MKYIIIILLLLVSFFAFSQTDTTSVGQDSVEIDEVAYEFVVVVDTIVQDSVAKYVKRLERRKAMSIAEYNNLLEYNRYLSRNLTDQIKTLRSTLELAIEELDRLGESRSLADGIKDERQSLIDQRESVKARIAELVAGKDSIRSRYIAAAKKKREKMKELEGVSEEAPKLRKKLQDAVDKSKSDGNTDALMDLLKTELEEIADFYELPSSGTKAVISNRIFVRINK